MRANRPARLAHSVTPGDFGGGGGGGAAAGSGSRSLSQDGLGNDRCRAFSSSSRGWRGTRRARLAHSITTGDFGGGGRGGAAAGSGSRSLSQDGLGNDRCRAFSSSSR